MSSYESRVSRTQSRFLAALSHYGIEASITVGARGKCTLIVDDFKYPCAFYDGTVYLVSGISSPVSSEKRHYISMPKRWKGDRWRDFHYIQSAILHGNKSAADYKAWLQRTQWSRDLQELVSRFSNMTLKVSCGQDLVSNKLLIKVEGSTTGTKLERWRFEHIVKMWSEWVGTGRQVVMTADDMNCTCNLQGWFTEPQAREFILYLIETQIAADVITS